MEKQYYMHSTHNTIKGRLIKNSRQGYFLFLEQILHIHLILVFCCVQRQRGGDRSFTLLAVWDAQKDNFNIWGKMSTLIWPTFAPMPTIRGFVPAVSHNVRKAPVSDAIRMFSIRHECYYGIPHAGYIYWTSLPVKSWLILSNSGIHLSQIAYKDTV